MGIKISISKNFILFKRNKNKKLIKIVGTYYSIINNMIHGVNRMFKKIIKVVGIGYKVKKENDIIQFNLGLSHIIKYYIPKDILIEIRNENLIFISGIDKRKV